ncbi:Uu.00g008050.m01.CDS01 [Anthostomella pinea]|uniref:Uu.00g008050.m01.CDS01 n=1 Tax=Anthostomella pinea TaxID=933095 RepID=A0AAI8VRD5_9PEZI|nr:Uu.00g008050.m01.CDS01 [Anthostomella pinea]
MSSHSSRPFSTTSQVYPAYLPTLHKSRRVERKLATATVAAVGIGYGLARYKQSMDQQRRYSQSMQAEAAVRRQSDAMMMDAYGDRSSLAELEAAVAAYDAQRKN